MGCHRCGGACRCRVFLPVVCARSRPDVTTVTEYVVVGLIVLALLVYLVVTLIRPDKF